MTEPDRLLHLLADHDAGLPVDPGVLDDPRARTMLEALAATRAELAALPPESPPPGIAARWHAALAEPPPAAGVDHPLSAPAGYTGDLSRHSPAAPPLLDHPTPDGSGGASEQLGRPGHRPPTGSPTSPDTDAACGPQRGPAGHRPARGPTPGSAGDGRPGPTPRRPDPREPAPPGPPGPGRARRPRRPRPAVVAGLALAAVLVGVGVVGTRPDPPSVTAAQLGGVARAALGVQDAGALADPGRRAACLRTVAAPGLAPDSPLAGSRTVVFEGHPGVILLLVTGTLGVLRAVVVDPGCGAGGGTLLADTRVGG